MSLRLGPLTDTRLVPRFAATLFALSLAACGGGAAKPAASVTPAGSPEAAVRQFMRAVADSDLAKMADTWGTAKGSALATKTPADWERRIAVIRAYLAGAKYQVIGTDDLSSPDAVRQIVQVALSRGTCNGTVPFTTIKAPDGRWIINQIALDAFGSPAKNCEPSGQNAPSTAP